MYIYNSYLHALVDLYASIVVVVQLFVYVP